MNSENPPRPSKLVWCAVWVILSVCLVACAPQRPDGPRVKTTPVSGLVLVDGQPAQGVFIKCIPQGASEVHYPIEAQSDADGRFVLGTYQRGDGLPAGSYKLTFELVLANGLAGPKDVLRGRYARPERSPFEITVADGEPLDLPAFELLTK